jgi:Holliday junction resolvasome RuvABC DNA-binding subunit
MAVPGIGRKGAQRIVLELAGRLGSPDDGVAAVAGSGGVSSATGTSPRVGTLTWRDQVRTGLVNLGWQARDAEQAIATIEPDLLAAATADTDATGGAYGTGGTGESAGSGDADSSVDVAVALRAALRVLGRT